MKKPVTRLNEISIILMLKFIIKFEINIEIKLANIKKKKGQYKQCIWFKSQERKECNKKRNRRTSTTAI